MFYDGSIYLWIPESATLPKANADLVGRLALLGITAQVGSDNPFWNDIVSIAVRGGLFTCNDGEVLGWCGPILNTAKLQENNFSDIGKIVAVGGDVEGFTVGLLVDDPTEPVPSYFPRSTVDSEPVSWNDWAQDVPGSKVDPYVVDGETRYKRLSHYYDPDIVGGGQPQHVALLASVWMRYLQETGNVVTHEAFNALGAEQP